MKADVPFAWHNYLLIWPRASSRGHSNSVKSAAIVFTVNRILSLILFRAHIDGKQQRSKSLCFGAFTQCTLKIFFSQKDFLLRLSHSSVLMCNWRRNHEFCTG